ncbi:hypothetical protein M6B38_153210 [Iris pallida]|uniref:Uncharacterized protein n=1 Tax=Iris pallida TaxID=29817 RepID=A0AAX6F556_IRIPA|nr:hypothetical protein M6B38_153210 [Iris pallida]
MIYEVIWAGRNIHCALGLLSHRVTAASLPELRIFHSYHSSLPELRIFIVTGVPYQNSGLHYDSPCVRVMFLKLYFILVGYGSSPTLFLSYLFYHITLYCRTGLYIMYLVASLCGPGFLSRFRRLF